MQARFPITGKLNYAANATLDSSNLATATRVVTWSDAFTTSGSTGTFASVPANTPFTFFAPWNFNSGPVAPFWTVSGFTFDLTASAVFSRNSTFLSVTGTGILSGNGFDPTPGTFLFAINDPSAGTGGTATFRFCSTGVCAALPSAVPESGPSLALLALALLALSAARSLTSDPPTLRAS